VAILGAPPEVEEGAAEAVNAVAVVADEALPGVEEEGEEAETPVEAATISRSDPRRTVKARKSRDRQNMRLIANRAQRAGAAGETRTCRQMPRGTTVAR
jgi:hypothetical protein